MNAPSKSSVILMADDDADDRLLAQDALAECKFAGRVHFVENGEALVDYLFRRGEFKDPASSPRPNLILLDLNMPKMDGREALREIKGDPDLRRIPLVVFTTSQADTDVGAVYELGANSFITKPSAFEALVRAMDTLRHYWFQLVELPEPKNRP